MTYECPWCGEVQPVAAFKPLRRPQRVLYMAYQYRCVRCTQIFATLQPLSVIALLDNKTAITT